MEAVGVIRLPQMPTYEETRAAVRALMYDDDPKPLRRLNRRAFWHGFMFPFGAPRPAPVAPGTQAADRPARSPRRR